MPNENSLTANHLTNGTEPLTNVNQLILDSVAEGIYGIDLDAKVIFWNKAAERLTGYHISDFRYHNLHELIHHTDPHGKHVPLHHCPVYHALNSGESMFVKDDIFWHKSGSSFPVEYTVQPIMVDGHHAGSVITFRDMTEKLKTDEIIQQWEKLSVVGQMAAGIAHEIRNPITTLKGFLKLMHAKNEYNPEYYQIMDSEFDRIESIIQELLTFSKPQSSYYENHDIKELVQQVVQLMQPQAIFKNISINTAWDESTLPIWCIEHQLKQVFINLIKNAIEALDDGGEIRIDVVVQEGEAVIRVKDNGLGIPPEVLAKMGEPFYSTKEKGTGLGLMVTFNIIRNNHNGHIYVESKTNEGTTFTIKLPLENVNTSR
ncbi:ATP-binding protein [Paenibacillus turpanensis]|uniref:ATP-binding protein n=1 Tax=Paenibacillus turpanensis TaxID=2689078 RepID=UPI00140D84E4|nr:ATP-binding protein [Paenibacillus turpanensis]